MWRILQGVFGGHKALIYILVSGALLGCGGGGGSDSPPPVRMAQPVFFKAEDTTLSQLHLYRVEDEGGALVQISQAFTNPNGDLFDYSISPDGQLVAYTADAEVDSELELYVVPTAGGAATAVGVGLPAGTSVRDITWSPDSTQFAYLANPLGSAPGGRIFEVFAVDSDGSNNRKISGSVGSPQPQVYLFTIRWSPDGRYLAQGVYSLDPFVTLVGVNTYDTNDPMQNSTRATPALDWQNGERMQRDFVWTKDSSRLVFRSSHEGLANTQLYAVLPDGTALTRINPNLNADGDVGWFSESPDGGTLVYAAQQLSSAYDIFASDVSGAGNRQLNVGGDFNSSSIPIQWSPDSSQIAYSTDQDTPNIRESYVTNVDGSGTTKLHADLSTNQFSNGVVWSPDGKQLAFVSDLDDSSLNQAYVVNPDGSNLINISAVVVPSSSVFLPAKWSPDGQHIAYLARTGADNQLELYRSAADGSAGSRLNADLANDEDIESSFMWSNDSSRIVFYNEVISVVPIPSFTPQTLWAGTLDGAAPLPLNGNTDIGRSFSFQY